MDLDDAVYLALLIFAILFGNIYKEIESPKLKRNVGTIIGLIIVVFVSGWSIWHPLLLTLTNALIITCLNKKIIHIVSFTFSFAYLLFFRSTEYFGIPYPPAHTNLVQMILTLKLVALAFEIKDMAKPDENVLDEYCKFPQPSIPAIFHYSFCYVGALTGPYYSYKTYLDMLNLPFGRIADCKGHLMDRLKYLPIHGIIFLASNYYFPFSYVTSDEFYLDRSWMYRLFYSMPAFVQFRMRMYIGMRLSEGVCIMAGMGAYPSICEPKPGKGPSKELQQIPIISSDLNKAKATTYCFKTVHNMEPAGAEFDHTVRSAMKSWNMTVQFWLAKFVYKRFPLKQYRVLATFIMSALWHGVYAGYYCTICSVPFYLPIEDIYYKNLKDVNVSPIVSKCWWLFCYFWRMLLMGYWGITFRLLTLSLSFKYWYSVYFFPTFVTIFMLALSKVVFKKEYKSKNSESQVDKRNKGEKEF